MDLGMMNFMASGPFGSPDGGGGSGNSTHGPMTMIPQANAGRMMKYVSFAIYTALLWDIAITYGLEIRHVYKTKWSLVKILWFTNRIGVPLTLACHMLNVMKYNPSRQYCQVTGTATVWLSTFNLFVIQLTLCLRVMAIYHRSKIVNFGISFLLFGSTLSRILIFALMPVPHIPSPNQVSFSGCLELPRLPNQGLAGAYWAPLILDTVLFLLTLVRVGSGIPVRQALQHAPLIVIIFRDGSLYFGVVVVTIAVTTVGYYSMPLLGPCTSSYLFLGIVSIACSRLLLNLRDATSPTSSISLSALSGRDVVFNPDATASAEEANVREGSAS